MFRISSYSSLMVNQTKCLEFLNTLKFMVFQTKCSEFLNTLV